MKIKFLSIAFVLALALASCGGKNAKDVQPTGEPAKDAKAYVEAIIEICKTTDDPKQAEEECDKVYDKFKDTYKDKESWKKFREESTNLINGEYREEITPFREKGIIN